jgi:hypothetical protein
MRVQHGDAQGQWQAEFAFANIGSQKLVSHVVRTNFLLGLKLANGPFGRKTKSPCCPLQFPNARYGHGSSHKSPAAQACSSVQINPSKVAGRRTRPESRWTWFALRDVIEELIPSTDGKFATPDYIRRYKKPHDAPTFIKFNTEMARFSFDVVEERGLLSRREDRDSRTSIIWHGAIREPWAEDKPRKGFARSHRPGYP